MFRTETGQTALGDLPTARCPGGEIGDCRSLRFSRVYIVALQNEYRHKLDFIKIGRNVQLLSAKGGFRSLY